MRSRLKGRRTDPPVMYSWKLTVSWFPATRLRTPIRGHVLRRDEVERRPSRDQCQIVFFTASPTPGPSELEVRGIQNHVVALLPSAVDYLDWVQEFPALERRRE